MSNTRFWFQWRQLTFKEDLVTFKEDLKDNIQEIYNDSWCERFQISCLKDFIDSLQYFELVAAPQSIIIIW